MAVFGQQAGGVAECIPASGCLLPQMWPVCSAGVHLSCMVQGVIASKMSCGLV